MSGLPVRIMVQDVWDQVTLDLAGGTPVREAKQRALALTHAPGQPEEYLVKFRGAQLFDEDRSLNEAGVVANSSLIVLPRQRRPVR
jgi:hypothetical protein